jgi:3-hydroxyisobutyrate dehydrogenase-like beta-hydroxyacid dehydrogenase
MKGMTNTTYGFIGLGNMGRPMAEQILRSGLKLTVLDTDAQVLASFRGTATIASSPGEVADGAEVVFACLPSPSVSLDVALGSSGAMTGKAVKVYVETSTLGTETMRKLEQGLEARKIALLDCPISGGPPAARTGTLSAVASGPSDAFSQAEPAIRAFAKNIFRVGDRPGQAQIAKLINNLMSSVGRVAAFEGAVMGEKAGLDLKMLIDFINVSTGRNSTTLDKFPAAVLPRTYKYGGHLSTGLKDAELIVKEAAKLEAPLFVMPKVLELFREAAAAGYEHRDSLRVIEYVEKLAGIEPPPEGKVT